MPPVCSTPSKPRRLQRYHVCPEHCTAPQVVMNGIVQRFCQQVGTGRAACGAPPIFACMALARWLCVGLPPADLRHSCQTAKSSRRFACSPAVWPVPRHRAVCPRHAQL